MTINKARVAQIKERLPTWISDETFDTIAAACGDLIRYIDQQAAPPDAAEIETRLRTIAQHLRADADFNRSWTDGRCGNAHLNIAENKTYIERRIEVADERDSWADAVDATLDVIAAQAKCIEALEKLLGPAKHYLTAYSENTYNHPQSRDSARDLAHQIRDALASGKEG